MFSFDFAIPPFNFAIPPFDFAIPLFEFAIPLFDFIGEEGKSLGMMSSITERPSPLLGYIRYARELEFTATVARLTDQIEDIKRRAMNFELGIMITEMELEDFDNTENVEEDTIMDNTGWNEQNDDTVRILANNLLTTSREAALIQEEEELKAEIDILKRSRIEEVEELKAEFAILKYMYTLAHILLQIYTYTLSYCI
uniref:Uncharacterized protein n=1 Tax=Glossina pallidipes TaxID=7398 RepID=A0A1B0AF23_GLOPL